MSLWAQCPVLPHSLDLNNRFFRFWLWFGCNQQQVLYVTLESQCRNWTRSSSSYPLLRKFLYIHWRDYTCDHCIWRTLKLPLLDWVSSTTVMKIGSWSSLCSLLSIGVDSNSSSLLAVTQSWDAHYSRCMVSQISSSGASLWWSLTVSLPCSLLPFSKRLLLELCSSWSFSLTTSLRSFLASELIEVEYLWVQWQPNSLDHIWKRFLSRYLIVS